MKIIGIYALLDPTTNEIRYIGKSKNIKRRYYEHTHNKSGNCIYLKHWLATLNEKPKLEIIELCDLTVINEKEKYWIKYYKDLGNKLTNLTDGGEGVYGYKRSDESKKRISESLKGHEVLPETRQKLREAALKQPKHIYTEEQKEALSKARIGMKFTEEHKKNIGLASMGRKNPNKPGRQIKDSFGNIFISLSKAALFHNIPIYVIWRILKGIKVSTIKFEYINAKCTS